MITPQPLTTVGALARRTEAAGFSGLLFTETGRTAYLNAAVASQAAPGLELSTGVAVAFPRSPFVTAASAWELQEATDGKFRLGLGTQVRAQIEKRYGTTFDKPVARMKELVGALRAIFAAWNDGERLDFRGEYYRHTLMTPTFNPGPNPFGPPPIYLGALGPLLTRATAEVADGLLVMPFGSRRFLDQVTIPNVRKGLAAAGRDAADFALVPEIIVSVGEDHSAARRLLGFYGSTPAYRPVLDVHGWGDMQPELNALSKEGRWEDMGKLIDDDVLHTIAACGSPADVAAHIRDRVDGVADQICLYQPGPIAVESLASIVDALGP